MGSPGAGKTVVGRILSDRLGLPHMDMDDDWLERFWGMPVSSKLKQLGSDDFIKAEGHALMKCPARGHIISLTGSNPMHQQAMNQFKTTGIVVFLDVDSKDILSRLATMKVNRIVGQESGVSMEQILHHRQQFYEKFYDVRILTPRSASPETQANLVQSALDNMDSQCKFISTRQSSKDSTVYSILLNIQFKNINQILTLDIMMLLGFFEAVLQGLASDGGLLIPTHIPRLSLPEWERLSSLSYQVHHTRCSAAVGSK
jgi:shikimate kinase